MASDQKMREHIFLQVQKARELLFALNSGHHVLDVTGDDEAKVEERVLQLFHLRQYSLMYKYYFQEWDHSNGQDQSYLQIAEETQQLHDLVNGEGFETTLVFLLTKLGDIQKKSGQTIHDTYMDKMGGMWKEAGLISQLQYNPANRV